MNSSTFFARPASLSVSMRNFVCLFILFGIGVFWLWLFTGVPVDDAYIIYRYAMNFARGYGLVFNIADPVEGYPCYLWVLVITLGIKLGFKPDVFSQWLGIASYVGVVFFLYQYGRARTKDFIFRCLLLAFFVMNPADAYWAGRGLETIFYSFLLFLAVYAYLKFDRSFWQRTFAGLLFCLMSMTRTEGIAFYGVVLCLDVVFQLKQSGKISASRLAAYGIGLFLYAFYFISRYQFYGYPLPNLYYLKVGFAAASLERGIEYLNGFLHANMGGVLVLLILSMHGILFFRQRKDWWTVYAVTLSFLIIGTVSGGDYFILWRYFVPVHSLIAILLAEFFYSGFVQAGKLSVSWRFTVRSANGIMIVLILLSGIFEAFKGNLVYGEIKRFNGIMPVTKFVGLLFKDILFPHQSIALNAIPFPAYFYDGQVYDMIGLTDSVIAHRKIIRGVRAPGHEKGDGAYILSMRPTVIIFGGGPWLHNQPLAGYVRPEQTAYLSEYEIVQDPVFFELYEPFNIPVKEKYLSFYKLKGEKFQSLPQGRIDELYTSTVRDTADNMRDMIAEKFFQTTLGTKQFAQAKNVLDKMYRVLSIRNG